MPILLTIILNFDNMTVTETTVHRRALIADHTAGS